MSLRGNATRTGLLSVFLALSTAVPWVLAQMPTPGTREQSAWTDKPPLTIGEALERTRAFSPTLKSRELQMLAVEALQRQAGRRPNPELDLELENFSGSLPGFNSSESTIFLSQQFERGGKRNARRRLARAGGPVAVAERREFELQLARDVAHAFAAGLAAQDRRALRRAMLSLAEEVVESAEQKVALGAVLKAEATRSRVTRNLAAIEYAAAIQDLDLARQSLARLWGAMVPDFGLFAGTMDTLRTIPVVADLDSMLASHPLILKYRADSQRARAGVVLQKSHSSQDLSLGAGFRLLDGADDGTFLVGLSMGLPFSDRNQGNIAAADILVEQANLAEQAAANELSNGLEQTLGHLAVAQGAIRGLRRDVLPSAQVSYDEVETAYRQGRLTYLDLLEARRLLAESRLSEIDWLARLYSLRAELEWTIGRSLPAIWEGSR